MLKYDDLTISQQKWVTMVNVFHPEIEDEITHRQIHEFHQEFYQMRKQDMKYKIGLPLWLVKTNQIRRGVYFFPGPGNIPPEIDDKSTPSEYEEEYQDRLKEAGII